MVNRKNALNAYQTEAHAYAAYGDCYLYPFLGLAGEAGEVCEQMKKLLRSGPVLDDLSGLTVDEKRAMLSELGDVLWYVSEITGLLGTDLDILASMNLVKLSARHARGTLTSVKRGTEQDKPIIKDWYVNNLKKK